MGRKKKKPIKPWCWYCNREFDDDKILAQHQRAKHFKCPFCHKKLYSGPGLTVHCVQVHKEKLDKIPEALPNRNSVDIDIYGMRGVPEEDLRVHERLKRGDDGASQSNDKDKTQQGTSQQSRHIQPNNHQFQPQVTNPMAMHAAMFQQAMTMGAIPPPGFPLPPPGMPMHPPGFPMGPPPGFPGSMLPPPPMYPGMPPPPPNFAFPPGMMPPPPTMINVPPPPPPPVDFPMPPPPTVPTQSELRHVSEADRVPPPPPMSGVGHLIGIPPPPIRTISARTDISIEQTSSETRLKQEENEQQSDPRSHSKSSSDDLMNGDKSTSSSTIAKPAVILSATNHLATVGLISQVNAASDSFIDVPSMKARIMHPNRDLSLEEMRLNLTRYQNAPKDRLQSGSSLDSSQE